jgi:nicotinate-nucleotide adenylyltransferase
MAETAIKVARLDAVYFVTSVNPPHKGHGTHANFLDRHAMVALALSGSRNLIPSSLEYDRAGKSYSIDTVLRFKDLAGSGGQIFFLIGLDAFLDFPTWKDFERFPQLCSFLVFDRPGYKDDELSVLLPEAFRLQTIRLGSLTDQANYASEGLFLLKGFRNEISSTRIRKLLREQLPVEQWLSPAVQEYISKAGLYSV